VLKHLDARVLIPMTDKFLSDRPAAAILLVAVLVGAITLGLAAPGAAADAVTRDFRIQISGVFDPSVTVEAGGSLRVQVGPKPDACIDASVTAFVATGSPIPTEVLTAHFGAIVTMPVTGSGALSFGSGGSATQDNAATCFASYLEVSITYTPPVSLAHQLSLTFVDPVGDNTGPIDVTQLSMTFDNTTGAYEIVLTATSEAPFQGPFRIVVNLWNPTASAFFSSGINDFDLSTGLTVIRLTGTSGALLAWGAGDVVATNTLAGLGNPPGISFFRTTVATPPFGFLTNEDAIAFGQGGSTVIHPLDLTPPTIVFSGNVGTYTVDQTISITCEATDALSGIATTTCPDVASGPATNFVGTTATTTTTLTATATDNAGNVVSASTTFTVTVTPDGICRLSASMTTAEAICAQVTSIATASNATAKAGMVKAFDSFLAAQTGQSIHEDLAVLLSRLAHLL